MTILPKFVFAQSRASKFFFRTHLKEGFRRRNENFIHPIIGTLGRITCSGARNVRFDNKISFAVQENKRRTVLSDIRYSSFLFYSHRKKEARRSFAELSRRANGTSELPTRDGLSARRRGRRLRESPASVKRASLTLINPTLQ